MKTSNRPITLTRTLLASSLLAASGAALADIPSFEGGSGNLYASESACACLLRLELDDPTNEDHYTVHIAATRDQITAAFDAAFGGSWGVDYVNSALEVENNGDVYFAMTGSRDTPFATQTALLRYRPDTGVDLIAADFDAVLGQTYTFIDDLVMGADGQLYVAESRGSLLRVDPEIPAPDGSNIGMFISAQALAALFPDDDYDGSHGLVANGRGLYFTHQGDTDVVMFAQYSGALSVVTAGPGVDPDAARPPSTYLNLRRSPEPECAGGALQGSFDILFAENYQDDDDIVATLADIPADVTGPELAALIQGVNPTVEFLGGDGHDTIDEFWGFAFPDGGPYLRHVDGTNLNTGGDSACAYADYEQTGYRQANATDAVEAVSTEASTGTFVLEMQSELKAGLNRFQIDVDVNDTAQDLQGAIEAVPGMAPGDVTVTGTGSYFDPWLFHFGGDFAQTNVELKHHDHAGVNDPILSGTVVDAGAFDNANGGLVADSQGNLLLYDAAGANMLYRIDRRGRITTFMDEYQLASNFNQGFLFSSAIAMDAADQLFAWNFSPQYGQVWNPWDSQEPKLVVVTPGRRAANLLDAPTIRAYLESEGAITEENAWIELRALGFEPVDNNCQITYSAVTGILGTASCLRAPVIGDHFQFEYIVQGEGDADTHTTCHADVTDVTTTSRKARDGTVAFVLSTDDACHGSTDIPSGFQWTVGGGGGGSGGGPCTKNPEHPRCL